MVKGSILLSHGNAGAANAGGVGIKTPAVGTEGHVYGTKAPRPSPERRLRIELAARPVCIPFIFAILSGMAAKPRSTAWSGLRPDRGTAARVSGTPLL
jgi:hypothetical protein